MRPIVGACAALLAISLLAGCGSIKDIAGERGSGTIESETRDVSGFDTIVVLGSGEVTVDVTGSESLVVEADDNLLPLLTTEVRNGRLELGAKSNISPSRPVRYTITVESLEGVSIQGSGEVAATGIDGERFSAEIDGSGDIMAGGHTEALDVSIAGSGSYRGEDLTATVGEVDIAGSGNALVNATDTLDVSVSGSGSVEYIGSPTLNSSVAGSGSVSQR